MTIEDMLESVGYRRSHHTARGSEYRCSEFAPVVKLYRGSGEGVDSYRWVRCSARMGQKPDGGYLIRVDVDNPTADTASYCVQQAIEKYLEEVRKSVMGRIAFDSIAKYLR